MGSEDAAQSKYTQRLTRLQQSTWKTLLNVQGPYRWNLRRLHPGKTIDVGCGIGRCLKDLPPGSIGIDHNPHSLEVIKRMGLTGFLPREFLASAYSKIGEYDCLLLSHILEHMTPGEAVELIEEYASFLKAGAAVIVICPQEKGFASDKTHVNFLDASILCSILQAACMDIERTYSFPFPRIFGKIFTYNEFVVVGRKR